MPCGGLARLQKQRLPRNLWELQCEAAPVDAHIRQGVLAAAGPEASVPLAFCHHVASRQVLAPPGVSGGGARGVWVAGRRLTVLCANECALRMVAFWGHMPPDADVGLHSAPASPPRHPMIF